jgi:CDP-diacylglycerol--inositol 3-phosphatidyltransferase
MPSPSTSSPSSWPVMLYVPNLIGYFRVGCMVASFYVACGCRGSPRDCDVDRADWKLAIFLYAMNFAGDVVDGFAARFMGQSSKYGSVLDMVTDRTSTAGLCALLAVLYPSESFVFILLIVLDIFSHWFHVVNAEVRTACFLLKWNAEVGTGLSIRWPEA